MAHTVEVSDSVIFIATDSTQLTPNGNSNFRPGDLVDIEYIENQQVLVIDQAVKTDNPYTEIWQVHHVELKQQPIAKKSEINYNVDTRFDRDLPDLVLWVSLILTSFWELSIIFNTIRNLQ
jgi:hypothetical protein